MLLIFLHFFHDFLRYSLHFAAVAITLLPTSRQSVGQPPAGQADEVSSAIQQQIEAGNWDAAAELAKSRLDAIELGNDDAAKWAIALSKLRVEILVRSPIAAEQPLVEAAIEPIDRILTAYPDHRFQAWLRFQRLAIDTAVARRRGLAIQAAPGDDTQRLSALASLIKTAGGLSDLQEEVVDAISQGFSQNEPPARIDQLMSLRNAIATERVGVLLSRGELFPAGSDDFLAAAEEANRAAVDALAMVRDDAAVQSDLVTMRCDALLRMGQPDEAAKLLAPLLAAAKAAENPVARLGDATRAMAVRIAIELNQLGAAEKWLDAHYGDQPQNAPPAPQSDLARLRFLIASESKLTDHWMEAINRRGGDYLYRRAQTIAIELLGPGILNAASGDLVISEAAAMMRKGDAAAAATLLENYLANTKDAQSALKVATTTAAVLTRLGRRSDAADLLAKTATEFEAHQDAADLMLQAAFMHDELAQPAKADQILQDLMNRWPTDRSGFLARDWLVERTEKTGTKLQAAIAATPDPATDAAIVAALAAGKNQTEGQRIAEFNGLAWQRAETFWKSAFAEIDPFDESLQLSKSFLDLRSQAEKSLGNSQSPAAVRCRKIIATLFLKTELLNDPDIRALKIAEEPLIDWLFAIRTGNAVVVSPVSTKNEMRAAAGMILMIDGQSKANMRATLSDAMIPFISDVPGAELAHSQALVWRGDWKRVPQLLDRWIAERPSGERTEVASMQAAKLISQANDPAAKLVAMKRYLKLSKDVSTQSPRWHRIKLAAIESMIEAGNIDEAKQLAKYTLITRPPADDQVKKRYEELSK